MGKRTQYSSYCRKCGRGTNKMPTFCIGNECDGKLVTRGLALKSLTVTPEQLDTLNYAYRDATPTEWKRVLNSILDIPPVKL